MAATKLSKCRLVDLPKDTPFHLHEGDTNWHYCKQVLPMAKCALCSIGFDKTRPPVVTHLTVYSSEIEVFYDAADVKTEK